MTSPDRLQHATAEKQSMAVFCKEAEGTRSRIEISQSSGM